MRVPALCDRSKVFVNGPGILQQCHPAHSQKPFTLARLVMLENRMGYEDGTRLFIQYASCFMRASVFYFGLCPILKTGIMCLN